MLAYVVYCYCTNGLAIAFNLLMVVLSSQKGVEAIQELRYFLSNVAASNCVFSACLMLLQPRMISRGTMTIRVILGPAQFFSDNLLEPRIWKGIVAICVVFYFYGVLSFPLFFIYRSVVLANSTAYGQYFNKRNMLLAFSILLVFCCVEGACLHFANVSYLSLFERLNRTTNVVAERDASVWRLNNLQAGATSSTSNSTGFVSVDDNSDYKVRIALIGDDYSRNPLILYFYGIAGVVHLVAYVIVLFSANFMLNTLKRKQGTMSMSTLTANEVLVHAVFAEAFLPLLLAVPVAANAILTVVYENSLQWQEFLASCLISLVPLLSPMISMFCIRTYRMAVVDIVTLKVLRKHQHDAADAVESAVNADS